MRAKAIVRNILPQWLVNLRHLYYAWRGAAKYHHPADELFVIGVTGTSGKSSVIYFLRQLLESAGFTVGALSTLEFCVAGECRLNDRKMTMLGKMEIQRYLRQMVDRQCDFAIVETTSEGYRQHRQRFINYDLMVLTNLYPEHIDSHGSFAKYKEAKLRLFAYAAKCRIKNLRLTKNRWAQSSPDAGRIPKTSVINGAIEYALEFLQFDFERQIVFGRADSGRGSVVKNHAQQLLAEEARSEVDGLHFRIAGHHFDAPVYGEYNIMNLTAVVAVARMLGVGWDEIQSVLKKIKPAPGRIEFISEAEQRGFRVIVDYAFEPVAMKELYQVARLFKPKRIIHVFGSTGGGRDQARRFTVGEFVGHQADICILTDEDPYDDDPLEIINDVATAVRKAGKVEGKNLFRVLNREAAIKKAVRMAQAGDAVLVTGKGSEQAMVVKGRLVPWDDRAVVREALSLAGIKG